MSSGKDVDDDRLCVAVARSERRLVLDVVDDDLGVELVLEVDDGILDLGVVAALVAAPAEVQN